MKVPELSCLVRVNICGPHASVPGDNAGERKHGERGANKELQKEETAEEKKKLNNCFSCLLSGRKGSKGVESLGSKFLPFPYLPPSTGANPSVGARQPLVSNPSPKPPKSKNSHRE